MTKFIVDDTISSEFSDLLNEYGQDSIHASEVSLSGADNSSIIQYAKESNLTIITTNFDFYRRLKRRNRHKPSCIIFLELSDMQPEVLIDLYKKSICEHQGQLRNGAIIIFSEGKETVISLL